MKLQLQDTVKVSVGGRSVEAQVTIHVEGLRDINVAELLAQVGLALSRGAGLAPAPTAAPEGARTEEEAWTEPSLDKRAYKSVHRVVAAIAQAGGKGLTIQEVMDKAKVSSPPMYKMIKTDNPQGEYASKYLRTTKMGRSTIVDLTPAGRKLASLVRAGKVPT